MRTKKPSPPIQDFSWGKLQVEGCETFKDAKLFPGGACAWDWSLTGTSHVPGIQVADVEELLAHGASTIILSKGVHQLLHTHPATIRFLEEKGVTIHQLPTEEAVRLYNQLCEQGEAVGALIHTTC